MYLIILKQKCLIPFLLRIVQCMLSINHIKRSMSINNTLVQVMYRYLMHVSLYGCMYLFDHTTKTYLMAALTRFQFSEGIYFFVIYYIMKKRKSMCALYGEKLWLVKGIFMIVTTTIRTIIIICPFIMCIKYIFMAKMEKMYWHNIRLFSVRWVINLKN